MKRFIAGAVCPTCRAVDRIVLEVTDAGSTRRCVSCGHSDTLAESSTPEPATRFTTRAHEPSTVQAVRLIDIPANPADHVSK